MNQVPRKQPSPFKRNLVFVTGILRSFSYLLYLTIFGNKVMAEILETPDPRRKTSTKPNA